MQLQPLNYYVCRDCYDIPQPQLRTIIIPPDPLPVLNARPEPYTTEVPSYRATQTGDIRVTEDGLLRVTEGIQP